MIKKIYLLTLFLFLIFTGCQEYSTENICGIYVVQRNDEFAKTNDTLIISKPEKGGFEITRKILSQYFNKNKKPFYKINHWTGNFNAADKSLLINNNGRILYFFPERNELQSGTIIFKKM
jgi:hypothetical protein